MPLAGGESDLRLLPGNLRNSAGGSNDLSEMLKGAGNRRQRFKCRQRAEDKKSDQRAGLAVAAYASRGEPQHSNHGNTTNQQHQRLRQRSQLCLTTLGILPALLGFLQLLAVALAGAEQHQFSLSLQPGG